MGIKYSIENGEPVIKDFNDNFAGLKINFLKEEDSIISLGLLANVLPLSYPELIIALSKSIYDDLSLSVNLGGSWGKSGNAVIYPYTTSFKYTFTKSLNGFIELYGSISSSRFPENNYDGGFTYLLSNSLAIDISGGKRFSGDDSYWFMGTGVSFQIK